MEPHRPRTAADLLSFADIRDIDEFIDGLRRFESGEWTPDQFKVYRLARGTYGQRQADVNMIRVKVPDGILTGEQLVALADVAETHSRGFGHITTRQNVQLHFVKLGTVPEALHKLAAVGLTTREACGNTVRNVTACAMAGACGGESFDVTPYGLAVSRHFLRRAENQNLPRKFKIAFSGCDDDCAVGAINDVGLVAKMKDGVRGFQVKVAGGLSTTPEDAHLLFDFLPTDELIPVIEAVLAVFQRHGNRQNKARARLKYVVRKFGWEGFRAHFDAELQAIARAGRAQVKIDPLAEGDALSRGPSLPIALEKGSVAPDGFAAWKQTNAEAQKQKGFYAATLRLLRGDITAAQMRGVARLARTFGDGMVRTTIDQNLLLRFVSESRLVGLYRGLVELDLAEANAHTIVDVTSCPGADSCNLAVTASRELASDITAKLSQPNGAASAVALAKDLDIKISGCPNSCGQHHIAGLGFHGSMRRIGARVVPEYTLHLGGGVDGKGAVFGRQIIKVPVRRVSDAVLRLLHLYEERRLPGESARNFFRRVDDDVARAAVADLMKIDEATAAPTDYVDLGDDKSFEVHTGTGECAV